HRWFNWLNLAVILRLVRRCFNGWRSRNSLARYNDVRIHFGFFWDWLLLLDCAVCRDRETLLAQNSDISEEAHQNFNLAALLGRKRIDDHCDRRSFSPSWKNHFREIPGANFSTRAIGCDERLTICTKVSFPKCCARA